MNYLHTTNAPAAVGPYSQGVVSGNLVYTSGQIALTSSGTLNNESIEQETRQVMENLAAILQEAGCDFSQVIQARIYITSRDLFPAVNKVYAGYFTQENRPARECVVALPPIEGAHVEISMVAEITM